MTKKKRGHPDVEELLERPWCYYCERDFDDLKILINHQKAKHFKCERCGRRLNTAGGLNVHMNQVHKETLTAIENALPNRAGPQDVEIFGMEGIPDEIVQQHKQRVLTQYHQAEADRRAATGNPPPGQAGNAVKKPKFESPSDLKKRLAEHKAAKLAAEQDAGGSSGAATPSSAVTQLAQPVQQPGFGGLAQSSPSAPLNAAYGQPPTAYPQSSFSPQPFADSPVNQPPFVQPYAHPPFGQSPYQPSPVAFTPPPFQPSHGQPQYLPHQSQVPQNGFGNGQVGAPRQFSASPAFPHQRTHSPNHSQSPRQNSGTLPPPATGLPSKPAVPMPYVNAQQFSQMHKGGMSNQSPVSMNVSPVSGPTQYTMANNTYHAQQALPADNTENEYNPIAPTIGMPRRPSHDATLSGLDELISTAKKGTPPPSQTVSSAILELKPQSEVAAAFQTAVEISKPAPATEEKLPKKDKDKEKALKPTRLVYSDSELSPEEKMAALPRYAFVRG